MDANECQRRFSTALYAQGEVAAYAFLEENGCDPGQVASTDSSDRTSAFLDYLGRTPLYLAWTVTGEQPKTRFRVALRTWMLAVHAVDARFPQTLPRARRWQAWSRLLPVWTGRPVSAALPPPSDARMGSKTWVKYNIWEKDASGDEKILNAHLHPAIDPGSPMAVYRLAQLLAEGSVRKDGMLAAAELYHSLRATGYGALLTPTHPYVAQLGLL